MAIKYKLKTRESRIWKQNNQGFENRKIKELKTGKSRKCEQGNQGVGSRTTKD